MSKSAPSWKSVINNRREENFVGRANQKRVFAENFTKETPDYMVFAITGEGGVGKSTLLSQFVQIISRTPLNAMAIVCDDRHISPISVMGFISEKLAEEGFVDDNFDDRYKAYRKIRQEIESDPKVPRTWVDVLTLGITDFTIKSLRRSPVGMAFDYVDEKAAGDAIVQLVNYGISKWGNKDEVELLREPERILTPLFVQLLNKVCEAKKIVLMFDVFERTSSALASWLLTFFNFEYGEFTTRLTFVISGRDSLEQHWTELTGAICYMPLEPFTQEETQLYLSNQNITDEQLVKQIHIDTGGLPVLVELLAATKPQPGVPLPDISKDAVARFLQWIPREEQKKVALLAAVPRQFNQDILSAVLGEEATASFRWLSGQSYIRTNKERGWFYHERVRDLMLRYLKNTTPSELIATHAQLSSYFTTRQADLNLEDKNAYDSELWKSLEIERIYHNISEEPSRNGTVAINAFLKAFRWRWRFAENITKAVEQEASETASERIKKCAKLLSSIYEAYEKDNYDDLIIRISSIALNDDITSPGRSALFAYRGLAYFETGKYEQALADFDHAIELDEKYDWAIIRRGETYLQMGKYEQALANFDHAIELDEKYGWAIASRGETYRLMGKYEQALADFDHVIELDEKDGWAIASRGETYLQMGKYEQALADFDRAIELDEKYGWAIASRGETYLQMGKYEQALADFDRAIELDEKYGWAIASRGETYLQMGKYEQALADFDRVVDIELDKLYDWAIIRRGQIYLQMGKYEQALADFNRVVELDEKYGWAFALRGHIYFQTGKYEQALADFDRAIELDGKDSWAIASRGQTYQQMGKYEQALADFDRAIELDEKYDWAIASRGETYRLMGKYEQALADFDRAIELNPENDWFHYQRAMLLRQQNEDEKAIEDLRKALQTAKTKYQEEPNNWRNMFNLALYHLFAGDYELSEKYYQEAILGAPLNIFILEAIKDLDDLLVIFSSDEFAHKTRESLKEHV